MLHDTALVWFRRDLRLIDNPALRFAVDHARYVVPVFTYAPDEEHPWPPGAASRCWLHRSLLAFDERLRERGSRLITRPGPSLQTLRALANETRATLLVWNRLYEPALLARDRAIQESLAGDVELHSFNANFLFEPGTVRNAQQRPYKVFSAFWRAATADIDPLATPQAAPRRLAAPGRWPQSSRIEELGLLPSPRWDLPVMQHWTPGERGALERLRAFQPVAQHYDVGRDRPDREGTSRLSPHLHFGEIGPRQILAHLSSLDGSPGVRTYRRELGWREFAQHLLHDFPDTTERPLDARFERMQWSRKHTTFAAWTRGMTGYPLIDAGMRELWHTGWMHNRLRMAVASFLTKNLQHHWLQGARWFWDTLLDADLANNTLGWQWTAGCGADAAPYFRIFNPVRQAERFDPQRAYIRRWVPELAKLADRWIHRPWMAPPKALSAASVELGKTYPRPIIDLARTRAHALQAYRAIRSG